MLNFRYILFFFSLLGSTLFAQASLKSEMFKMESAAKALVEAEEHEHFQQLADHFIKTVEDAIPYLPGKILDDDERAIDDYQRAMQDLIDVANNAKQLAESGELRQAKETVRQIFRLKSFYHLEYK